MKKSLLFALIASMALTLISCASTSSNVEPTLAETLLLDGDNFPKYTYNDNVIGKELVSPVAGKITSVQEGKFGTEITITCKQDYYWEGKALSFDYDLVFVGVKDYVPNEDIVMNQIIGTITNKTAFTSRASEANPFMVRMSGGPGIEIDNDYYFLPSWITGNRTFFLNYRQIDSINEHSKNFYERWAAETEDPENLDDGNHIVTIFNYPELDSVRAKIVLNEYPKAIEHSNAGFVSNAYFGANIFLAETKLDSIGDYTPCLYWQEGFVGYLQDEYTLGTDLYVYCTFLGLDNQNKKLVINVRDFAVQSDEDIVASRLLDIEKR